MKILAIETSTMLGGIAVADDSTGLIAEVRLNVKSTHSERLMTEIDHVMVQSFMRLSEVDVFAVAIGPGSFTGLRIGLSTVKGLSYATGKPIVAVPTLEAFAWNFPYCRYPLCPMLDARKKEVYTALFRWDRNGLLKLMEEVSISVRGFLDRVSMVPDLSLAGDPAEGRKIVFAGEGAILYKKEIVEQLGDAALFAPDDKMAPSPASVAMLGLRKALRGDFSEPVGLAPSYIRSSEAEVKWRG
jgi:tRNA threonylcarbamoyladenosine biosynthesis protein TsaB